MSEKLFESDFLTVNLQSILNNAKVASNNTVDKNEATKSEQPAKSTEAAKKYPANYDWAKDLKARLDANRNLDQESRESEYTIKKQFWNEYFNAVFGSANAELLKQLGDQLQNDITVLGFKKAGNPILAFLSLPYVQKELLQTKLLNSNTYKAIHNAIAKKQIAHSEFFRVSNYNIIYCKDLYTKSVTEISTYLDYQKKVLVATDGKYTVETQNKNKRIFLQILKNASIEKINSIPESKLASVSTKSASVLLNDISLVHKLIGDNTAPIKNQGKTSVCINTLASKLKTPEHAFATIQYLSIANGIKEARAALSHKGFSNISAANLKEATALVSTIFSNETLSNEEAKELVSILVSRFK